MGDYNHLLWTTLAEFPGIIFSLFLIERIGRKHTMALEFLGRKNLSHSYRKENRQGREGERRIREKPNGRDNEAVWISVETDNRPSSIDQSYNRGTNPRHTLQLSSR